jgi:hypothetical protein
VCTALSLGLAMVKCVYSIVPGLGHDEVCTALSLGLAMVKCVYSIVPGLGHGEVCTALSPLDGKGAGRAGL